MFTGSRMNHKLYFIEFFFKTQHKRNLKKRNKKKYPSNLIFQDWYKLGMARFNSFMFDTDDAIFLILGFRLDGL